MLKILTIKHDQACYLLVLAKIKVSKPALILKMLNRDFPSITKNIFYMYVQFFKTTYFNCTLDLSEFVIRLNGKISEMYVSILADKHAIH